MRISPAIASAILAAALWLAGCSHEQEKRAASPPVEKQAATVQAAARTIPSFTALAGDVTPQLSATLAAKIMARVVSVEVREGDRVQAGQVLLRLDDADLSSQQAMAAARSRSAGVAVQSARVAVELERQTAKSRVEQARAAVRQAQAQVRMAEAQQDLAVNGPRTQERIQADLAVDLAQAQLDLAEKEHDRVKRLVDAGAVAGRLLDTAEAQLSAARIQRAHAEQNRKITAEGTRLEEVRKAREGVAQARQGLLQAEASLRQAISAQLQIRVREDALQQAAASEKEAEASLQITETARRDAVIRAPFAGIVSNRMVDPGDMAQPGMPLLAVEGGSLRLEALVPESNIRRLAVGQSLDVQVDALGSKRVQGTVAEIPPRGDGRTHTFVVRIAITGDQGVKSGMYGKVMLPTGVRNVVTVPASAVLSREGLHYVLAVSEEGLARLRLVTVGETRNAQIEVLSGLNVGERILQDSRAAQDGDRITGLVRPSGAGA
jgi:RND family efflux transporter MFP subunit